MYSNISEICDTFLTVKDIADVFTGLNKSIDKRTFTELVMENVMTLMNGDVPPNLHNLLLKNTVKETTQKVVGETTKGILKNTAESAASDLFDLSMELQGINIDLKGVMIKTLADMLEIENIEKQAIKTIVNKAAEITDVFAIQKVLFLGNKMGNKIDYNHYLDKLQKVAPVELKF